MTRAGAHFVLQFFLRREREREREKADDELALEVEEQTRRRLAQAIHPIWII